MYGRLRTLVYIHIYGRLTEVSSMKSFLDERTGVFTLIGCVVSASVVDWIPYY